MKKVFILVLAAIGCCNSALAQHTLPISGTVISAADSRIQYAGRISLINPERPAFNFPGIQITAAFEGTSLKMIAKPESGYFMAQIDNHDPFKVAFSGKRDSVVTLATALPEGRHLVKLMYAMEGYERNPEFWGFVLDRDRQLVDAPAPSDRKLEFVGNSITCGYGNEGTDAREGFCYETENHYYSYAAEATRQLNAQHWVVARSGIGAYRNYDGPKTGTPDSNMPAEYEYTMYAWKPELRVKGTAMGERWDFARYQPDVVCINLGTNDLSTNNYDVALLKKGYKTLLRQVRTNNPKAKIIFLCGSMLNGKELELARQTLDAVAEEARKQGDKEVYRFNFTPQAGDLGYGNDYHPSLWQHRKMAAELVAFLRPLMQWW